jgi:hypothetical protein
MASGAHRSSLTARIFPLGHEPTEDLRAVTTPAERLAMVADLSDQAWSIAGLPRPQYSREQIPVQFLGRSTLLANKRATGRLKDLADLEALGES